MSEFDSMIEKEKEIDREQEEAKRERAKHYIDWEDDQCVGFHCSENSARYKESQTISAENPTICYHCGQKLKLIWNVSLEKVVE